MGSVSAMTIGANAGGTLVVHANPEIAYTADTSDYCGQADVDSCGAVITSVAIDTTFTPTVFFVIAAFPEDRTPRLTGVTFGVDYDDAELTLVASGNCGDLEVPMGGWPDPGTGIGITWEDVQTSTFVDVYWFAGYAYSDTTSFQLSPHPTQGGTFADDAIPSILDEIADYGRLGFGTDGHAPCPALYGDEAGYRDIGGQHADVAPGAAIVRFRPGAVTFPDGYDYQGSDFTANFADATFDNMSLAHTIDSLGIETFETIAPEWRFFGNPPAAKDNEHIDLVDFTDVYRVTFDPEQEVSDVVDALMRHGRVEYAEGDAYIHSFGITDDDSSGVQWGLENFGPDSIAGCVEDVDINAPAGWAISTRMGTKVAIIDQPVNRDHEDFAGLFDPVLSRSMAPGSNWWTDDSGHGTWVAGVAGARTNNGVGIAGVTHSDSTSSWTMVALPHTATTGPGWNPDSTVSRVVRALDYLARDDVAPFVRAVNISWGFSGYEHCHSYSRSLRDAMRNAFLSDLCIVCSAGNGCPVELNPCTTSPPDSCGAYPAAMDDYAIAVSAVDCAGEFLPGAHIGSYIDVAAPGVGIVTLGGGENGYESGGFGTSVAAPHVTGLVALMLGLDQNLTNEDCSAILGLSAADLGLPSIEQGAGIIRMDAAMSLLQSPYVVRHESTSEVVADSIEARWVELRNIPVLGIGEAWDSVWVHTYELRSEFDVWSDAADSVLHVWPRGRTSSGAKRIDFAMGYRYDGYFHSNYARLDAFDGEAAEFTSYTYRVFADDSEEEFLCWYPWYPASAADSCGVGGPYRLDYSLVVRPGSASAPEAETADDSSPLRVYPSVAGAGDEGVRIELAVAAGQRYSIEIFDVAGRRVRSLVGDGSAAVDGIITLRWDRTNDHGDGVGAGVYFVRRRDDGGAVVSTRVVVMR